MKQIDPVDQERLLIIDLSIYDAMLAEFDKVICIIKPEIEEEFREAIGDKISKCIDLEYAHQTVDRLPAGFCVPDERKTLGYRPRYCTGAFCRSTHSNVNTSCR